MTEGYENSLNGGEPRIQQQMFLSEGGGGKRVTHGATSRGTQEPPGAALGRYVRTLGASEEIQP